MNLFYLGEPICDSTMDSGILNDTGFNSGLLSYP
jgi:hypothetical protein